MCLYVGWQDTAQVFAYWSFSSVFFFFFNLVNCLLCEKKSRKKISCEKRKKKTNFVLVKTIKTVEKIAALEWCTK